MSWTTNNAYGYARQSGGRARSMSPVDSFDCYERQAASQMELHQAQLQFQLQQMQLKNLEMQSALLAQAAAVQNQQYRQQQQPVLSGDELIRSDALNHLERAQRQRHASANVAFVSSQGQGSNARLSFGTGSDGLSLAEHARARHARVHSHDPSSVEHQPTLVLSKPGEAFPVTKQATHRKSDSSSSSSASSSAGSESLSFDSAATSVGSPAFTSSVNKLSAAAAAFQPSNGIAPPPLFTSNTPPPTSTMGRRAFVPLSVVAAVATRQPRGPAREEEMETKNFATRIRAKAVRSLKGRASFVGVMGTA